MRIEGDLIKAMASKSLSRPDILSGEFARLTDVSSFVTERSRIKGRFGIECGLPASDCKRPNLADDRLNSIRLCIEEAGKQHHSMTSLLPL